MRHSISLAWLLAALSAPVPAWSAQPATPASPDPAVVMRRIGTAAYRYGGEVAGLPIGDPRPLHLSVGLDAPAPDGTLRGEAILFAADRRLVGIAQVTGSVTGRLDPGPSGLYLPVPATGRCHLRFAFPAGETSLDGTCARDGLSGEIVSAPPSPGRLAALIAWWDDRAVAGRAWLTPASFDP